jgi:heme A synthase
MGLSSHRRFRRFAAGFLVYLLGVILFGAWVRITHSGAGCGSHWPTCNGQVLPLSPSLETLIEFTHRLTSGLLGILGLVLVAWALRLFDTGRAAIAAAVTLVFIVVEALIGAGLVLRELVADDDSVARAIVITIHLVNTLVLTAAASLTAWWSFDRRPLRPAQPGTGIWILALALLAIAVTSMTGAVTALGDTLFPVDTTAAGGVLDRVRDDLSPAKHFLVRLRIFHPVVAVVAALVLYWIGSWVRDNAADPITARLARGLQHAVVAQVVLGVANIALAAPGWLQLGHLLLAQAVWIAAVLTTVSFATGVDRPAA